MINCFPSHESDSEYSVNTLNKFPLCSTQRAVWLEQTLNPDTSLYNISTIVRIDGKLDSHMFIKAFYSLPRRHDALRLRLLKTQGLPLQECTDNVGTITTWDFSQQSDAEERARIKIEACFRQPFNLYENLWRSELLKVSDTCWYWQFCSHHLISDGLSLRLIIEDLADCYNKVLSGQNTDEIAPSYFDFIREDSLYLNSKRYKKDLNFWIERYEKLPPALFQRSADNTMTCQKQEKPVIWQIENAVFQLIKDTMAEHGLSVLHFMYAVLACYLTRSTGEEEIVIGIPIHNRKNAKQKRTLGMFSLVISVRITVDLTRDSFLDVMHKVAAELRHCYKHQRLPITEINRLIKLKQKTGRSQLFDITLSFELFELNVDMQNCVTELQKSCRETMFPLSVAIHQYIFTQIEDNADQPAIIEFNFDPNYFCREEIIALQSRLAVLTEAAIQSLDTPISTAKILPFAERQRLLTDFNATDADFPREALIHRLFEQQAERTPEATALVSDDDTLSYAELNCRANRLAHQLLALGVQPDDRVALCAERSTNMMVALLAILKAGGAYVPLDPAYPTERLAFMLDDAAPVALLTQSSLAETLNATLPVILLDVPPTRAFSDSNPDVPGLTSAHLAYVIYTSGTTGKPKGVMVEHVNVINLHAGLRTLLNITHPCRVDMNAGIVFDASVKCWLQLLSGHTLVIVPQAVRSDSRQLWRYFARHRVDLFDCTPVQLQGLLESGLGTSPGYQPHRVLTGGDAILPLAWRAMQQSTVTRFINVYGPTECTVDATACTVSAALPRPCIGRPLANTCIYILDVRGQPVPQGVAGEIHIGGVGVARGYLNRPELTAERFIPDAFSTDPLARLYRTGDLGRWLPDGSIEYLGRNDFQLKLRGFRIEPGEIEARLAHCSGVLEAVVIAREDTPGDRRLVAYLRPQPGARPDPADLRRQLAGVLADYMIPAAFVTLDAFPLTPNGKLDRKALPVPDQTTVAVRRYEAPAGEPETRIAAVWQALLGVARIGRHDHFFELGDHSLLAVQLLNHLSKQGMKVSLSTLFSSPTLCDLAQAIKNNATITESPFEGALVPLSPEGHLPPLFLVHETSGDPLVYSPLARLLPAELPVYALQALGIHTQDFAPDSLEALASYHIQAIRRVQAHGPYHLAGWSLGEVIAREIADRLINHGEGVGFLGMIDSFNSNNIKTQCHNQQTGNPEEDLSREQEEINLVINYLRHKMRITDAEKLKEIYALNDMEQIFTFCHQHQWLPVGITKEDVLVRINTQKMFGQLGKRYHASASSVPVHLYTAETLPGEDAWRGWRDIVGAGSVLHPVGGSHQTIMQPPRLNQIADSITGYLLPASHTPDIIIQRGSQSVPTLFCLPGAGASASSFIDLALPSHLPVHALQARGLTEPELPPFTSVEEAARAYIQIIRQTQSAGPCHLLGHSFGGWIAFEMALQLQAQGEEIGTLILVDTSSPDPLNTLQKTVDQTETLLTLIDIYNMMLPRTLPLTRQDLIGLQPYEQIKLLSETLVDVGFFPANTPTSLLQGIVQVMYANLNTIYIPRAEYQGPLYLINAEEGDKDETLLDSQKWKNHATQLNTIFVPGNHMTMLSEPHVRELAEWLTEKIKI